MRTYLKLALTILAAGVCFAAITAACSVPIGLLSDAGEGEPTAIALDPLEQRSYLYSADGSVMAGLHGGINREPVELDEVPQHLVDAILAVEDQGFWVHDGVDGRGILRAFSVNVGAGDVSQGGSTLTQQIVKLALLGDEQSLERKVQEFVLARRLENEMSKEEILTRYINVAYFGNGAYGVEAAAETYFGTSASELEVSESALLAGMIRNPRYNDPVRYPENAERRRSVALSQMESLGFIDEDERAWSDAMPLPEEIQEATPEADDYFADTVLQELLDIENERFHGALGDTYEERERAVFQGGLRVHTTLDSGAQLQALAARNTVLPGEGAVFDAGADPATGEQRQGTGAMVSIDPASGAVRTMVAGPGFRRGVEEATGDQFNLVTQNERQIGSTTKTFTLVEAMEQGYSMYDQIDGTGACRFDNPDGDPDPYEAINFGDSTGEIDTLLEQTARSSNCAYIRLALIVGYENVAATSERMGVSGGIGTNLASALGSTGVTPLDMASSYATLANEGVYNEPYYIQRIEGADGRVIYEHEPAPERVISAESAQYTSQVLEYNVTSGTGRNAAVPGHQTAGKTGTTSDNADVWFIGYTAHLATAAWVGGLDGNFRITIEGASPSSSQHPARMFGHFMSAYHEAREPVPFGEPEERDGGEFLRPDADVDLSGSRRPPSSGGGDDANGGGDDDAGGGDDDGDEGGDDDDAGDDDDNGDGDDGDNGPGPTFTVPDFTLPTQPAEPGPGDGDGGDEEAWFPRRGPAGQALRPGGRFR